MSPHVHGDRTEVYTDGACSGNPGPGGWAWAVAPEGDVFASGGDAHTTNQRMELMAVLEALRSLPGELVIVERQDLYRNGQRVRTRPADTAK